MSNSMLLLFVVLLIILNLYIALASVSLKANYNDGSIGHYFRDASRIHTHKRDRRQSDLASSQPLDEASRVFARISSHPYRASKSNNLHDRRGTALFDASTADSMAINGQTARDNKIDELFFDQQQQQHQTKTYKPILTKGQQRDQESLIGEPKTFNVYNTINLDNSLEEPETFINNHQSSSFLADFPSNNNSPPSSSGTYNSRHYTYGGGYHQQASNNNHLFQSHQQHNYGKYSPNMFANNYNLNYIHSFLTSKQQTTLSPTSGNLFNVPNFLSSNSNGLTLNSFAAAAGSGGGGNSAISALGGGYGASAYISASSALSATINNHQLPIVTPKQQQLAALNRVPGSPADAKEMSLSTTPITSTTTTTNDPVLDQSSNLHHVNASIANLPGSSMCGRQQVGYREPRIVGGNSTYGGEFPWAVSIQRHGNHHCGGVIVGKRWILTAAHCVRSQLVTNLIVRTGGHTLTSSANSLNSHLEKDYQVEQIVMHDDFSRYDNLTISQLKSSANTNNADIALLKLKLDIHWNELAWPVCFPNREAGNFSGHDATVIGWGKLNEKSEEFSNELQKVKLTIIDNKDCQNWFRQAGRNMPIDDRIICAGFKSGGKDACHGDSGGPLLSRINGQYVVVGVVSTGIGCARPLLPGLYSRVSSYINWIERYITN